MTPEEYKQLEDLLSKLRSVLGERYCIIPEAANDGVSIALYDRDGEVMSDFTTTGPTIQKTIEHVVAKKVIKKMYHAPQ